MRALRFEAEFTDGGWRPMLPPGAIRITYYSMPGPERHEFSIRGLVDSGSTHVVLTSGMLPADVPWDGLRKVARPSFLGAGEPVETRIWRAEVAVCDYLVSADVTVMGPGATERAYLILGTPFFERFVVGFGFSNRPRYFDLAPVGQLATSGIEIVRAPEPLRVGAGPLRLAAPDRHARRRAAALARKAPQFR